jgi:hypothetical protein
MQSQGRYLVKNKNHRQEIHFSYPAGALRITQSTSSRLWALSTVPQASHAQSFIVACELQG